MPLTPAEVHNVAFKKPPIGKRGYDEEEVDAFLDIVEVELARLIEENNDLRSRGGGGPAVSAGADLAELDSARDEARAASADRDRLQSRVQELEQALTQSSGGSQEASELQQRLAAAQQQSAALQAELDQVRAQLTQAQQAAAQAPAAEPAASQSDHSQAVQVLALAQQTADQLISRSQAEAGQMVAEARASVDSIVTNANEQATRRLADAEQRANQLDSESRTRAAQMVSEAEQRAAAINAQLEQRRGALERRLEELRTFEREYRSRLKNYLESQLRDLDASGKPDQANANGQLADAQQG